VLGFISSLPNLLGKNALILLLTSNIWILFMNS
jgi:hypothetical protein